ncbi:UBX domain-containing protein 6 [Nymphon striatum]|nr:UBX domain-containing protein 6 [Nymphon striatum]
MIMIDEHHKTSEVIIHKQISNRKLSSDLKAHLESSSILLFRLLEELKEIEIIDGKESAGGNMSSIKKFFEKKKNEFKFKKAGPGHKLTETTSSSSSSSALHSQPQKNKKSREPPSDGVKMAAAAALARFQQNEQSSAENVMAGRSVAVIRAEARKELEKEKSLICDTGVTSNIVPTENQLKELKLDSAPVLAVSGVYFHCPLIGNDVLPRSEIEEKIKEFLYNQLHEERGLTACLIIHTCNKNIVKVQACIETLKKYIDNILIHPDEDKYIKIRVNNKVFQEKVLPIEGSSDFLIAAGFEKKILRISEDNEEEFLVFTPECSDFLVELKESLDAAEPILPELYRNLQYVTLNNGGIKLLYEGFVYVKSKILKSGEVSYECEMRCNAKQCKARLHVNGDTVVGRFNDHTYAPDIGRPEVRTQQVQLDTQLKTKAMREKEEVKEKRRYRYTLIRVRFPDDYVLQVLLNNFCFYGTCLLIVKVCVVDSIMDPGTFRVGENVEELVKFIKENLSSDWLPFNLKTATGQLIEVSDASLLNLHLVPAAIIHANFDATIINEIKQETGQTTFKYLNDHCMGFLQET